MLGEWHTRLFRIGEDLWTYDYDDGRFGTHSGTEYS